MEVKEFNNYLKNADACERAIDWSNGKSLREAWEQCERGDWLLWLYSNLFPENKRQITLAKGLCAKTVYGLMTDKRSRDAVDVAIRFGRNEAEEKELAAAAASAADAYPAAAATATAYASYPAAADAAAAYAADAADNAACAAATAAAYAASTRIKNRKETADICREVLTETIKHLFTPE